MTTRIRTRNRLDSGTRNSVVKTRQVFNEYCIDTADEPNRDKGFQLYNTSISGSVENGKVRSGIYSNYPTGLTVYDYQNLTVTWPSSEASLYSRMCAGTAPKRSAFSIPTFLAELKDLGSIVRDIHNGFHAAKWLKNKFNLSLAPGKWVPPSISAQEVLNGIKGYTLGSGISDARKLANANLAIQFGYLPYVNDFMTALGFMEALDRRRKELSTLRNKGVLKRRWTDATVSNPTFIDYRHISEADIWIPVTIEVSGKRWATIRWSVGHNTVLPQSDADLVRDMLGLHPRALLPTLWEVIPFSFLVDYFSNVGDILNSVSNGIEFNVVGNVMSQVTMTATHPAVKTVELPLIDLNTSAGVLKQVRKSRVTFKGMPGFILFDQIIGPKQLSILGSLSITRRSS